MRLPKLVARSARATSSDPAGATTGQAKRSLPPAGFLRTLSARLRGVIVTRRAHKQITATAIGVAVGIAVGILLGAALAVYLLRQDDR